ncbi:tRNA (guanine(10)-N(2))-dimethyltransferase [Hydrogenivirga sp. 128-5-R1-1]|uniref:tRNA (guanine(10)-N(2))-dimethyltransferase n=1 Tax=Hydrogenivirga sp. 128-5-R1-1 TaxID=392423 RepID=UPI00015EF8D9|nr:tRNA (guanine(10)-N(2))-dimethyltransferase [Hydrogenivirga sp. 128-5-R1-1]EDP75274.1 N(2),N(2)-dimethylguanosine tRNA methyltransferase [Hydrogenivirga sp. 128-5-R1-1]
MKIIQEGKAKIRVPELREIVSSDMPVFYNPRMRVNRDLAVLGLEFVCRKLGREVMVADPLAASGIRSIRFLKETDCVGKVFANDINEKAAQIMEENFRLNEVPPEKYEVHREEANYFLRKSWGFGFDYVDLDPFGTPVPFVESVALSMKRGGLLSLTATDTAPLSGTYPKTCVRRYGARPLRNEFKHEVGIRILIKKVIELGAQHDIAMIPMFAYSHLHYFKLFFMKDRGAKLTNSLIDQVGYILYCFNCLNREAVFDVLKVREFCPVCGTRFSVGGPLWLGKLWDEEMTDFIYREAQEREEVSKETKRITTLIWEESKLQTVGFYLLSKLSEKVGIPQQPPIRKVVEFYEGTRTHFAGDGFRTRLDHLKVLEKSEELKGIIERRLKGGV